MQIASKYPAMGEDRRHPVVPIGETAAVYVWQFPLRMIHWGIVLSIGALSFTGYYIQNPFIIGQSNRPFLMGWFRFTHEATGMLFAALILLRLYLFFGGNRWVGWRQYVPLRRGQWAEMGKMIRFYLFISPRPVSKIGNNSMAALSYLGIYALMLTEIVTGLVMFNWLRQSPVLTAMVGWIPRFISMPNLRLIHFLVMFALISFGVFHVHLAMLISREEKRGLMDSIFTGYKVIPAWELDEEERKAEAEAKR